MKKILNLNIIFLIILTFAGSSFAAAPSYEVLLNVTGNNLSGDIRFGVDAGATDLYDSAFDAVFFSSHSSSGEFIDAHFDNSASSQPLYNNLFIQKNAVASDLGWIVKVQAKVAQNTLVTLSWKSKVPLPPNVALTLTDGLISIDMLSDSEYTYLAVSPFDERIFTISESVRILSNDTDRDGMSNSWEVYYGFDPNDPSDALTDADSDGLTNLDEFTLGTNPHEADSDFDGVIDSIDSNPNNPSGNKPTAVAGTDQVVGPTKIVLDGSSSSDPTGDVLTYMWGQDTSNPEPVVFSRNLSKTDPTTDFSLKKSGVYIFSLRVSDGIQNSSIDTVSVEILNITPTASAGTDRVVDEVGQEVILDGSGSTDANADSLTYQWSVVSKPFGSLVTIDNPIWPTPSFNPVASGVYVFGLTVSDGVNISDQVTVNVTTNYANTVPVADAGTDQIVLSGSLVTLDASKSTDGGDGPNALSYAWTQNTGSQPFEVPVVNLSSDTLINPAFTPFESGTYRFDLVVYDGKNYSIADFVLITVNTPLNTVPVSNAGTDLSVDAGDTVSLGAAASYDDDGDTLTYIWEQRSGTTVTMINGSYSKSEVITFIPLGSDMITFRVKVFDGTAYSGWDSVVVWVTDTNTPPVASVSVKSPEGDIFAGDTVVLDGSLSMDVDTGEADTLAFIWTAISGGTALSNTTLKNPSFVPLTQGVYVFELRVKDVKGAISSPVQINVVVNASDNMVPVAGAVSNYMVYTGDKVTLDGSLSSDSDGDGLIFTWVQAAGNKFLTPLTGNSTVNPTLTPTNKGTYNFILTVNDGKVDSQTFTVTVEVVKSNSLIQKIFSSKDNIISPTDNPVFKDLVLDIPLGAVTDDTMIAIGEGEDEGAIPKGVFMVGSKIELIPYGLKFNKGISLSLPFDAFLLQSAPFEITTVKGYRFNGATNNWDEVSLESVDHENGMALIKTDSFATFTLGIANVDPAAGSAPLIETEDNMGAVSSGGCFISFFD